MEMLDKKSTEISSFFLALDELLGEYYVFVFKVLSYIHAIDISSNSKYFFIFALLFMHAAFNVILIDKL